ncbi:hypothetical protein [Oricola sp.]|uniref:hypothetical protein n=1 Tax=Oricola sp. TaxID=1979950 RepID=UPI0025F9ED76|nr:hypothetical protein [Oricola sp.]MCI5077717.1 hypothetical protein [Oricola sp.]
MNFLDYALHHIACTVRLVRGDAAALDDMDITVDGFWRSFEALPAALPALIFSWVVEARQLQAEGLTVPLGSILGRMALLELVFWIAPVIVLAFVLNMLGLGRRFTHLIVARNWLAAFGSYLFVVIPLGELTTGSGPGEFWVWMTLFAIMLMLWFSTRVTRQALDAPLTTAIAFVGVEAAVTYPLAVYAYAAAGLYPVA